VAAGCAKRGLACVQYVDRPAKREKGLVYRLASQAAALILEDQPAFVAQWQAERVAAVSGTAVFAVNAACLVPPAALEQGVGTTSAFRRRHEKAREEWQSWTDEVPDLPPYSGPLPYEPDYLGGLSDAELDAIVASCAIDHALAPSPMFPATRAEVLLRLSACVTRCCRPMLVREGMRAVRRGVDPLSLPALRCCGTAGDHGRNQRS
jgi:deoxyribodipyrimidine photo-lyase